MKSYKLKGEKEKYEKLIDILEKIGYSVKEQQQKSEWKLDEKASFLGTVEWAFSIPSTKNFMNWLVDTLEIGFSEKKDNSILEIFPNKLGVLSDLEYKAFEEINNNNNNAISLQDLPNVENDDNETIESLTNEVDSLLEEFEELEEEFDLLERQYTHMTETLNNQKIERQKIKISNSLLENEANENDIKTYNLIAIMDSIIREGIASSKELITNNEISNLEGFSTNQSYIYQCLSDFSKYISQENIYDKMLNDYNDIFISPFTDSDESSSNENKQLDINNDEVKYEMKRLSSVYIDSQKSYFNALMKYKKLENQKKILLEYENATHLITQSATQLKCEIKEIQNAIDSKNSLIALSINEVIYPKWKEMSFLSICGPVLENDYAMKFERQNYLMGTMTKFTSFLNNQFARKQFLLACCNYEKKIIQQLYQVIDSFIVEIDKLYKGSYIRKNIIEKKINTSQVIISKQLLDFLDILTQPLNNNEIEKESGITLQSEKILNRILKLKNNLNNYELDKSAYLNEYIDNLNEIKSSINDINLLQASITDTSQINLIPKVIYSLQLQLKNEIIRLTPKIRELSSRGNMDEKMKICQQAFEMFYN
ncbi:hypothetical protein BCR32DRAFT_290665 [Anaeromyces robustus]|uniref:HAUS augmin-like complex subunit 3 N-terminal domain-containing protein n=1 Tax=Anaeromyces robustus TaxID=1754192 RepID=A0A1Y1XJ85_9FUNG|nr:hypothetical protein BCR32DRAFT_290665 [Anaeromyces robustus]|eukprot:ORX85466.1 hypothetical protein BCR32DRAFT_290665 [Anaeromyces robustus]